MKSYHLFVCHWNECQFYCVQYNFTLNWYWEEKKRKISKDAKKGVIGIVHLLSIFKLCTLCCSNWILNYNFINLKCFFLYFVGTLAVTSFTYLIARLYRSIFSSLFHDWTRSLKISDNIFHMLSLTTWKALKHNFEKCLWTNYFLDIIKRKNKLI